MKPVFSQPGVLFPKLLSPYIHLRRTFHKQISLTLIDWLLQRVCIKCVIKWSLKPNHNKWKTALKTSYASLRSFNYKLQLNAFVERSLIRVNNLWPIWEREVSVSGRLHWLDSCDVVTYFWTIAVSSKYGSFDRYLFVSDLTKDNSGKWWRRGVSRVDCKPPPPPTPRNSRKRPLSWSSPLLKGEWGGELSINCRKTPSMYKSDSSLVTKPDHFSWDRILLLVHCTSVYLRICMFARSW